MDPPRSQDTAEETESGSSLEMDEDENVIRMDDEWPSPEFSPIVPKTTSSLRTAAAAYDQSGADETSKIDPGEPEADVMKPEDFETQICSSDALTQMDVSGENGESLGDLSMEESGQDLDLAEISVKDEEKDELGDAQSGSEISVEGTQTVEFEEKKVEPEDAKSGSEISVKDEEKDELGDAQSGSEISVEGTQTVEFEEKKVEPEDAKSGSEISVKDEEKDELGDVKSAGSEKTFVYFANQDAKVTPSPILQYVLDVEQPFDTVISCSDGKIGAHRLVLAAASPFLGQLFSGSDHRLGEVASLILPDVRMHIFKSLLNFCYTGSMTFPVDDEEEIFDTMQMLLMGEFAKLKLQKVTIRGERRPFSSESNITSEQQRISRNIEEEADEAEMSIANENEDIEPNNDEGGHSRSDTESESEFVRPTTSRPSKTNHRKPVEDNDDVRPAMLLDHLQRAKNSTDVPYNYIIIPPTGGSKLTKLQCSQCPAAFKSTDTLETHLEDYHDASLESHKVSSADLHLLLKCNHCKTRYRQVDSANNCLKKHHRTRCFTCLESIRLQDLETHVRNHGVKQRNGSYVIKCKWCDAGVLFQKPFDNKAMTAHCSTHHFSNKSASNRNPSSDSNDDLFTELPIRATPSTSAQRTTKSTSPIQSSTYNNKGAATPGTLTSDKMPTVLAMLQRASQKRKAVGDTEFEEFEEVSKTAKSTTSKRVRMSNETEKRQRLQVAKRTGKPVGIQHEVDTSELTTEGPSFTSYAENPKGGKGTQYSVMMNVEELPQMFISMSYERNFVLDQLNGVVGNPVEGQDEKETEIDVKSSKNFEALEKRLTSPGQDANVDVEETQVVFDFDSSPVSNSQS